MFFCPASGYGQGITQTLCAAHELADESASLKELDLMKRHDHGGDRASMNMGTHSSGFVSDRAHRNCIDW